jgi:glutamyl-tRNA reductase
MQLRNLHLTFKNAPLEVREKWTFDETETRFLLADLKEKLDIEEVLVISTCNRTEIFYIAPQNLREPILEILSYFKELDWREYSEYFIEIETTHRAINRLMRISVGAESQVLGDFQITNQVKRAYQWATDAGTVGTFLHRLMHLIFQTHKRIAQETNFRDGAASVSYAATELVVQMARHATDALNPTILIIGMGEIGEDTVRNLHKKGIKNVLITNRTYAKAALLATENAYDAVEFERIEESLAKADVVVCSIAKNEPFITKSLIQKLRATYPQMPKHQFFIDLSLPRSIESDLADLGNLTLFNLDQIHERTEAAIQKRREALPKVERIISEMQLQFEQWVKEQSVSPALRRFKEALEQIRQEEINRFSRKISEAERGQIEEITKNILQKILKKPALHLKMACKRGEESHLVDALRELFNLEKEDNTTAQDISQGKKLTINRDSCPF